MRDKVIKNPDSPGGRKDWEGREPRWRVSLTDADTKMLIEMVTFFLDQKHMWADERYANILIRLRNAAEKIPSLLMADSESFPLFEDDLWGKDK